MVVSTRVTGCLFSIAVEVDKNSLVCVLGEGTYMYGIKHMSDIENHVILSRVWEETC